MEKPKLIKPGSCMSCLAFEYVLGEHRAESRGICKYGFQLQRINVKLGNKYNYKDIDDLLAYYHKPIESQCFKTKNTQEYCKLHIFYHSFIMKTDNSIHIDNIPNLMEVFERC